MALSKLSLNPSKQSNKTAKKVTIFHRPESKKLTLEDDSLFSDSGVNFNYFKWEIDMDVIRNLLLDYISTSHAQEILENSLINLMSLKEQELPEEFKSPCWEEKGRETISNLILGYPFFSEMTPDYCISFPRIMSQFVSEELHNKFISDAIVYTRHIKKSELRYSIPCHKAYLPYLLMTDCSPTDLVTKYPNDPKKVIDSMVELYHNYFDIQHFDIEAHALAARKSLVYEIKTTIMFH